MQVVNIINKDQLNSFVFAREYSPFLQSWQWGEFQKKVSGGVWRIGVEDGGKLIAAATIVKKNLPAGKSYFYCARGPVIEKSKIKNQKSKIIEDLLFGEIEKLAGKEGVMFLRFDPLFEIRNSKFEIVKTLDVQPSKTLILNLAKSEDELLKEMRQKTRYNIKLAEKKGVKVSEGPSIGSGQGGREKFEEFWRLLDQTSDRDKFRPHGRNYYEAMLASENDIVKLFFAEYDGRTLATGVFSFFGDTVAYLHGGSASENREVMAPYLLQWHAIKFAKNSGYKYFDFHGIDEEKWPGVTRFKKGFGGSELNYPGTFDLIYDEGWYAIYKMVRKVRRTF